MLVRIYKHWINKSWYIHHVNKRRGNFPLWNRMLHFVWMSVFLSKEASSSGGCKQIYTSDFKLWNVCVYMCLCASVFMSVNSVHPSVSDFLMTLWVTEQVTGSWDLLPIPGRDTPAASGRSNQRWLTLKEKQRWETTWVKITQWLRTNAFYFVRSQNSHLLGLVEAVPITVGEVESCELLSQFLLRAGYHVQGCVQFNVTGTLCKKMKDKQWEPHINKYTICSLQNYNNPSYLS